MVILFLILFALSSAVPINFKDSRVTRKGNELYLDGSRFTFGGCNIYWLGLDENVNGTDYPTQFRVDDVLATAKTFMGATVVRAHTLGISTGNSFSFEPKLDVFNHTALKYIDYAVYRAGQLGIKLVVPLTDNWHYYHGGKHDFTDWHHVPESEFYTNAAVIKSFKNYIAHLLNHTNQYTGVRYGDDSTVMAWETGNELKPPPAWTKDIATFLKGLAPNTLVLDGNHGVNPDSLPFPEVDLYSQHYYPEGDILDMQRLSKEVWSAGKVFFVGEFGWNKEKPSKLQSWLQALVEEDKCTGDLYWSLFGHLGTNGYEQHGGNSGYTLHYPGDDVQMREAAAYMREHAYKKHGSSVPTLPKPTTPKIDLLLNGVLAWRGSAGAYQYSIQQKPKQGGSWKTICTLCATDNETPWKSSEIKPMFCYTVIPHNLSGDAGMQSEVVCL